MDLQTGAVATQRDEAEIAIIIIIIKVISASCSSRLQQLASQLYVIYCILSSADTHTLLHFTPTTQLRTNVSGKRADTGGQRGICPLNNLFGGTRYVMSSPTFVIELIFCERFQ